MFDKWLFMSEYKDKLKYIFNHEVSLTIKKSLVLEPWTSKISGRTSIRVYFHQMCGGQVKNSMQVYLTIYFRQVIWQQDK